MGNDIWPNDSNPAMSASNAVNIGFKADGAGGGIAKPILGNILGAAAGALIGGVFDLIGGNQNRKAAERAQREAKEMSERQWDWGQTMDRFKMGQDKEAMAMAKQQQAKAISKARVDQINEMLRTNVGLQNQVRQLWGGR
ncbi:MAG: hypothetical protein FWC23_08275 [Chitinispirillia bacterium]|nr:hypothetical protein [Chitinispirillia bacterium]MCL2269166.1 hypothetical protein [Chitinispirillia bacterium]